MDFSNFLKSGLDIAKESSKNLIKDPNFWINIGMRVVDISVKYYESSRARKYEEDLHNRYKKYKEEYERNYENHKREYDKQKEKKAKENAYEYDKYKQNCANDHIKKAVSIINEMRDLINSQNISDREKKELFDIIERHSKWIGQNQKGTFLL